MSDIEKIVTLIEMHTRPYLRHLSSQTMRVGLLSYYTIYLDYDYVQIECFFDDEYSKDMFLDKRLITLVKLVQFVHSI